MSDHQARSARDDVYDHEHEEPRSGRRRRPVADWGVGDDVFEHMPRNRFSRAAEAPPRERRFAREDGRAPAARRRGRRAGGAEPRARRPPADGRRAAASTTAAARSRIGKDEDVPSEIAAITADRDIDADEDAARRPRPAPACPSAAPSRSAADPRVRWRPRATSATAPGGRGAPRTSASAHRPDRLAMWAFALGMLLILIAVLTAL